MKELITLQNLINSFKEFPSIGEKTAERLAFYCLNMDESKLERFIENLKNVKVKIHECPNCGLLCEDEVCEICSSDKRDHSICIVLSNNKDVYYFEKLNTYKGIYHVLGGDISSIKGITPDKLKIKELINRIENENIKELIIATTPSQEGETTALYIAKLLENYDIKITRLAYGLPMGGNFEYADELTILKALDGRTTIK